MKLIVGLGNPGREYSNSRHNTGWQVVEGLIKELGFDDLKKEAKFKANVSRGTCNGEKIILVQPLTYMNLSGESVSALMNFYKLTPSDLWIIYDDLDLALSQIRIRKEGGPGTHNGMKSVIASIGDDKFPRFRIGIESRGITSAKEQDTSSFVLSGFSKDEKPLALSGRKKAVESIICALNNDIDSAMNIFNAKDNT